MRGGRQIAAIIPALDEEESLPGLLAELPDWLDQVVVVDNGSRDATAARAVASGATLVREARRGYGAACLAGIAAVPEADILVFLDADGSDRPAEMADLIAPVVAGRVLLNIGSRTLGDLEPGALTPTQRFGNALACGLIRLFWRARFSDLGPYRAIERRALETLAMADRDFGWTVEMQVKAARLAVPWSEVPVAYRRRRQGKSKISGTLTGSVKAGAKILAVIAGEAVKDWTTRLTGRQAPQGVRAAWLEK